MLYQRFYDFVAAALILAMIVIGVAIKPTYSEEVTVLARALDSHAVLNNLPAGDGNISFGEEMVATALWDELSRFDQAVTDLEQADPYNAAWVESVEATLGEQDAAIEEATSAPMDVRDQLISDVIAHYHADLDELSDSAPVDPRAAAIFETVSQTGQDADLGNHAISEAIAEYEQEILYIMGKDSLSESDQQLIHQTIQQALADFINRWTIKHKHIVQYQITSLVAYYAPSSALASNRQNLPLDQISSLYIQSDDDLISN